jgi:hypothetical protein
MNKKMQSLTMPTRFVLFIKVFEHSSRHSAVNIAQKNKTKLKRKNTKYETKTSK